jgi:hypothetical protein
MAIRSVLALASTLLLVTLGAPPPYAADAPTEAEKRGAQATAAMGGSGESPGGKVYTNEDLEQLATGTPVDVMFKPSAPPTAAEPTAETEVPDRADKTGSESGAQAEDSAGWLERRQAESKQRERQIAEAQDKVDAAAQRVSELEDRLRKVKNPLLARPEIPEDERGGWQGMSNPERLTQTEAGLKQAREELAAAREEMVKARAASG